MKNDPELKSLIALFDDPDRVVREAVVKRLLERGEEAVDALKEISYSSPETVDRNSLIINFLSQEIVLKRFEKYLSGADPLLTEGVFLVTKIVKPSAEESVMLSYVESRAEEITVEISESKTAVENIEIFNYIFFRRLGFDSTDNEISKEDSTLLDHVLKSRRGNPISVSVVYFILARRTGLPLYPLCFPGGFVPAYKDMDGRVLFYMNIFKHGEIFLEDRLKQYFEGISFEFNRDKLVLEGDRALVSIYAELIGYLYNTTEQEEGLVRVKRVLDMLGEGRYL